MPAEPLILEPQFKNPDQQRNASLLGMWVFIATELLMFGSIVTGWLCTRVFYPFDFAQDAGRLNILIGLINTLVLLTSSFTMSLADRAAQRGDSKMMLVFLPISVFLGVAFLGLKGYEYYDDYMSNIVPLTNRFLPIDVNARRLSLYMMFYFILTGMHAVHLTIGVLLVSWLAAMTWKRHYPRPGATITQAIGLYWHFVDVIWMFLFCTLYLSGHHEWSDVHF
jgi:cytochrome c oxidase subunit 3